MGNNNVPASGISRRKEVLHQAWSQLKLERNFWLFPQLKKKL